MKPFDYASFRKGGKLKLLSRDEVLLKPELENQCIWLYYVAMILCTSELQILHH